MTLWINLRIRENFAAKHMLAATKFSRLCQEVEEKNNGCPLGDFYTDITSYTTATVMLCIASLESNINEIFADAQCGRLKMGTVDSTLLDEIWRLVEQKSILDKYGIVAVLSGKDKLNKSVSQYQNVKILIGVRNALVHFKPEWNDEKIVHKKIGNQLKYKFALSPFINEHTPIFPQRVMTYGFAAWAVEVSLEFMKWFAEVTNIPNWCDIFKEKLS